MKPIDPVFSWSWATPFFVAILAAELFITFSVGYPGSSFGALAFAWLMTLDNRSAPSLLRGRLGSLCFAGAFLMVFLTCGDVIRERVWREVAMVPTFGLIIAGIVFRGTRSA